MRARRMATEGIVRSCDWRVRAHGHCESLPANWATATDALGAQAGWHSGRLRLDAAALLEPSERRVGG